MQDAITADQYFQDTLTICDGNVDTALTEAEHVLEGECRVGGQDHFYLETHACLAVPKGEDKEMEIISSTQAVSYVQECVAAALNVQRNRIVCKVKRIGIYLPLYVTWNYTMMHIPLLVFLPQVMINVGSC